MRGEGEERGGGGAGAERRGGEWEEEGEIAIIYIFQQIQALFYRYFAQPNVSVLLLIMSDIKQHVENSTWRIS